MPQRVGPEIEAAPAPVCPHCGYCCLPNFGRLTTRAAESGYPSGTNPCPSCRETYSWEKRGSIWVTWRWYIPKPPIQIQDDEPVAPVNEPLPRKLITVCDRCLMASCWQGVFMCENAVQAGTVNLPIETLQGLRREHGSWWDIDPETGCAKRLTQLVRESGR